MFKTHVDIFSSWDAATGAELRRLAAKHGVALAARKRFTLGFHAAASQHVGPETGVKGCCASREVNRVHAGWRVAGGMNVDYILLACHMQRHQRPRC